MLRNRFEELDVSCVREETMRRGAVLTAILNIVDGYVNESVSVKRAMEQRKAEAWTLELGKLWSLFCKHHDFFWMKIRVT